MTEANVRETKCRHFKREWGKMGENKQGEKVENRDINWYYTPSTKTIIVQTVAKKTDCTSSLARSERTEDSECPASSMAPRPPRAIASQSRRGTLPFADVAMRVG